MVRYETLMLAVPEITESEISAIENTFSKIVKDAKGKMVSWEKWGKYLLAYPVNKHTYGVYVLARFEIPVEAKTAVNEEIKSIFSIKYNTIVSRYMTSVLSSTTGWEYKRPTPLDETPKNVSEFLKENKMEGLVKNDIEFIDDSMIEGSVNG